MNNRSLLYTATKKENSILRVENAKLHEEVARLKAKIETRNNEICALMLQLQVQPVDLTTPPATPQKPTREQIKRKTASDVIDRILSSYLSDDECKEEIYYDDEPVNKRIRFNSFSQSE